MVLGRLIAVVSLVAEHGLWDTWASVVVARGLSCPVACGILDSGQRIEPMSPALARGFLTTGPPGSFLCVRVFISPSLLKDRFAR